jgi:tetratricopeptide (TPR) repeat protein
VRPKTDALDQAGANQPAQNFGQNLADAKFAKGEPLTYRASNGDVLFALQLKAKLPAGETKPVDYVLMADTSASQARGPLAAAIDIVAKIAKDAKPADRLAVWTINIPAATNNLTHGFKSPKSPELDKALQTLKNEVPLGDTDLKNGLRKAVASFENNAGRRQVVVLLGDGMSLHDPIMSAERAKLADELNKSHVSFFAVPLGPNLDPANLHGLAAQTGGAIVRATTFVNLGEMVQELRKTVETPVFYPTSFQLKNQATDVCPTTLPPLRPDTATLVVGKMKDIEPVSYTIDGSLDGKEMRIKGTEYLPQSETDNFFLISTIEQWKHQKDEPALNRADRLLAYSFEKCQMARNDLLVQAEWALSQDKYEAAERLFDQAKKLDPNDVEAKAGFEITEKLKDGIIKKDDLKAQLAKQDKDALVKLNQQAPAPPPGPPVGDQDLLQEQKRRTIIEEQRSAQLVDEALRQARRLLQTDPDAAHDLLKQMYATVRDNPDIGERVRQALEGRLEDRLRNVDIQGARIKQERDEQLQRLADARRRFELQSTNAAEQERTRARMQAFSNLMAQARYEDAYLQALAIEQDAVTAGRPVPIAATAGYDAALVANNYSQIRELERTRQERFLLTMMQVERSHVPFPDEPPIQFPPAAVWKELTRLRKDKYESSGFGEQNPETIRRLKEMRTKLSKPVTLEKGFEAGTKLKDALDFLSALHDVTFVVNDAAFASDLSIDNPGDKEVSLPRMSGVTLETVLRLVTEKAGGTFIVRPDYIEITTGERAVREKVIRVYPVADLVTPIPNAFNPSQVQNVLSILGTAPGLGLQLGGPQALGNIGQGLGLGGLAGIGVVGLGALGGAGGGLGGLGGLGGIGGLGGLGGAGLAGGGLGGLGGGLGAAGGMQNLGFGGGQLGFGGGMLGQLGNVGGQFGLQGGDQSLILVRLIREVIGNPREWAPLRGFNNPQPLRAAAGGDAEDKDDPYDDPAIWNSLGYYPPARALVVKGTSRVHAQLGGMLSTKALGGAMGALPQNRNDVTVIEPPNRRQPLAGNDNQVAANVKDAKPDLLKDLQDKKKRAQLAKLDPRKIWQDALEQGVNDPGLIIAVSDFLVQIQKFDHAAEFLKANLRQGIVVRPWVYESLAIALESSHGSPDDIERARLSAVDLEPNDAQTFVLASRAMADMKRYDRALAFCRQAAILEPNTPDSYEAALLYAELAKDSQSMEWASGRLLRQEWPSDNQELHAKAAGKLNELARTLEQERRETEARRMLGKVQKLTQRDLVVNLRWEGDADLDLEVTEPIGTVCSFQQRQTPGGGILLGDTLTERSKETYVAARAFSGEYKITVRRIWGRPLGGKATIEIVQHQGLQDESRRLQTVTFDRQYTVGFMLENGRRTETEFVNPVASRPKSKPQETAETENALNKLIRRADPDNRGASNAMAGSLSSVGVNTPATPSLVKTAPAVYQAKLQPLVKGGAEFTLQDTGAGFKISPVFQSVKKTATAPVITNPLIPGDLDSSNDQ